MTFKRTMLITGCSDGSLGSVLALHFHKAGWRVFASARTSSKLTQAKYTGIEAIPLDTLSDHSIRSCVSRVHELTGGSLDALFNNAGAGYSMPLMELDIAKARGLFDLNVWCVSMHEHGALVVNNTSARTVWNRVVNLMTGSVRSTFHDNAPTTVLPSTSLHNVAKETVEKIMSGGDAAGGSDPDEWANRAVLDLSKRKSPYWVSQGKFSTTIWLASHLPAGAFDGTMKKLLGWMFCRGSMTSRQRRRGIC
ncbi:hypothetical protein BDV12DRAFT_183347 [Aspergillus spectabilis]